MNWIHVNSQLHNYYILLFVHCIRNAQFFQSYKISQVHQARVKSQGINLLSRPIHYTNDMCWVNHLDIVGSINLVKQVKLWPSRIPI
jgi:hypothetical protein